jgi:hypothetical protein
MTRSIDGIVVASLFLLACRPAERPEPEPGASTVESRPASEVVLEEQGAAPSVEEPAPTWRFTTLVTGGTEAFERMIGTNGYYELVLEGETATVRKVGQKGTPVFADDEIQTGVGVLVTATNSEWPAAERRTLDVELSDGKTHRHLVFDLWFFDDEIHGTWAAPNLQDDAHVGDTWGLVQGRRDAGDPLEVSNGASAPCMVCARAFWNCEGRSFDEPACNSAATSWSKCEARLEKARKSPAELPRGCDDWM